jgi:hypothetical protein
MEGSLGGFVFRTGKPWTGTAADVLQLGLEDDNVIPEGLKTGCLLPLVAGIVSSVCWVSADWTRMPSVSLISNSLRR